MKNIFICGCGHSGTTLLLALLSAHPSIYGIKEETGIFLKDCDDASAKLPIAYLHNLNNTILDYNIIVEKTPRHVRYIPEIMSAFPESKIIVCYRNPLDNIASLVKRGYTLEKAIYRYNLDNSAWIGMENIMPVKYELLVADYTHELTQICNNVGIVFSDNMLLYWKLNTLFFGITEAEYTESILASYPTGAGEHNHLILRNYQLRQPIEDKTGEWKTRISIKDAHTILKETKVTYTALGYTLQDLCMLIDKY